MGDIGSLRVPRPVEHRIRPPGIPARLRSLLSVQGWGKSPEPRVRYGQSFLPGLAALGRATGLESRALLERAEAVRGRRFTHLGRTLGFPGRIDWDPQGLSRSWRVALNALDEVAPLGVAAALAPNPDARRGWYDVAAGLVRDWIGGAPPGRGVAWSLPALARRIPNLVYAHACFGPELRADPRQRRTLLESLYIQAAALAAAVPGHPADDDLIAAGRALFVVGRFFDGMEARGWLEAGAALLWRQLREQVNDDGGHRSRDLGRHARVLASYLEVLAILQAANDDVPIWARKRVKGMADFFARLLHPDEEIPLFHGATLEAWPSPRELLAAAAVVLHEPGFGSPGDLPGMWPLLVLGEPGRRVYANLPRRRPAPEPRALRRTGFYVLPGDAGDLMLLDGESPPPGGDANVFGYELSVGGLRLVVDAGPGGEEGAAWSEYFASARAHNVVSVGGAEPIAAGRPPVVGDVQWVVRDGLVYFSGTHDGFARLALDLRLRHRRRVFCLPGRFWLVCDEILGTGECGVESFVHLHPAARLTAACRERPAFVVARSGGAWLRLVPAGAAAVRVVQGLEGPPPEGWHAARAGERRPAPTLSLATAGRLPLVFGYALLPRTTDAATLRFEHDAFRLHAALRVGDREHLLTVVQGEVEFATRRL